MKKVFFLINKYDYLISHKIDMIKLINNKYNTYIFCPGLSKKIFRKDRVIFINIDFDRKFNLYKDIKIFFKLLAIIHKKKPDIVHTYTIKLVLFSSLISLFCNIKFVLNFSGLGNIFNVTKIKFKLFKLIAICTLRFFDSKKIYYIFQTKSDLEVLIKHINFDINRSSVIQGSGVDISKFKKNNKNIVSKKITVLLASRMLINKGILDYVEMSKFFLNKNVTFLLIGGIDQDNDQSLTLNELNSINLNSNVKWLGFKKNIYNYYNTADIFCLPTYYGEGIPKVLLEAASMSLPIIASDIPGCNDAVINDYNGYLIEPKNVDCFINKLSLLIEDRKKLNKFSLNSRKHVVKNFSLERIGSETLNFYDFILNDN